MDVSGLATGKSSADDERPVLTGQLDKKAWFDGLTDYVNSMKEICPDYRHPSMEWLSSGFSMISLDQGRTAAATPEQGGLAAVRLAVRDKVSQPLSDSEAYCPRA